MLVKISNHTIHPVADELFHADNTDAKTLVQCGCILSRNSAIQKDVNNVSLYEQIFKKMRIRIKWGEQRFLIWRLLNLCSFSVVRTFQLPSF